MPHSSPAAPVAATAGSGSGSAAVGSYGSLVDTLYRCRVLVDAGDRRGRELLLLHKAHVACYRTSGLLGSPVPLPHSNTAAAAAADSVDRSAERLAVQLKAASITAQSSPSRSQHVDTAVFDDSDWSDDEYSGESNSSTGPDQSGDTLRSSSTAAANHHSEHSTHDGDSAHRKHSSSHSERSEIALLERLLVLFVDVFCEQSDAFAPFAARDRTVHGDATLLYEHITQKTHKASAFHSLTRNLRWLAVKSHLIAFFTHELSTRRTSAIHSTAATTTPTPTSSTTDNAASRGSSSGISSDGLQASHVLAPTKSRVHALLSSLYHHGAAEDAAAAHSHSGSAAPPLHSAVGVGAEYFRRFNVACSELHALYTAASSTVNAVLEESVLAPSTVDRYDSVEQLNAAVVEALRSAPVMELIASYHAAYQRAVISSSPGYVLLSRTMRHRIESDEAFLAPASFTDLIVAVHGVSALLVSAFQAIVVANASAAVQLLTSTEQLQAIRTAHQQGHERQQQQEVEAVSAWLYDSRVYPKPLTAETFSLFVLLQVRDATVLREMAAERFEEAVERLRALNQPDKAALLTSLTQQRQQQKEALMSREIANASRASHLGLSTALLNSRHSTSDSVHIELLRNDSDAASHSQQANTANKASSRPQFEPLSPNPNLPSPAAVAVSASAVAAPHLQPKHDDSNTEQSSTKLDDIVKWIDISPQYVVGLGRDNEWAELRAFAVFDKTFTEPTFGNIKDILVTGLTTREKIHSSHLLKAATHTSKTMADFVQAVLFSSASATSSETVHVGPDFFADPLIVWKEGKKPFDVRHITRPLPFNDIDWLQMFVDNPALTGILHSLCDVSSLVDSESDVRKPLSHSSFVPTQGKDGATTGFVLPLHRSKNGADRSK